MSDDSNIIPIFSMKSSSKPKNVPVQLSLVPPLGRRLRDLSHKPEAIVARAQDIEDRVKESKRIIKRLIAIIDDHRRSAVSLGIDLTNNDIGLVTAALKEHANGGSGVPINGARDEIHQHVLTRMFEELVEEPSNILFTTATSAETIRYDAMEVNFWIDCLTQLEKKLNC
jgi:hypothetical protein